MLSKKKLLEIREHLDKAQNPVFFFDNDCDGLMAFIILRRYCGKGKGVAIKSFPNLDKNYIHRVEEFNADYIFVLDKPVISNEFVEEAEKRNIPVIWIDHHDVENNINSQIVSYYNPFFCENKSSEPTSYIVYKATENKKDLWFALAGCIADNFMPDFINDFVKSYPDLWNKEAVSPFEILYQSEFGKLVMMLDFSLKDRTTNVISMINLLLKINSPFEILKEDEVNYKIVRRYNQIKSVYSKLLERAKKVARTQKKVVFFQYSGDLSLSSDLANELSFRFPGKIIIVAYIKGASANISVRGRGVRRVTLEAIESILGATGGGHENATGAKMSVDDLPVFISFFSKEFERKI